MRSSYLKVPVELSEYALRERRVGASQIYLFGIYFWPGKIRINDKPYETISIKCGVSSRTVYSKVKWLLEKNWMGKDSKNGWLFFRSLNYIHHMEGWRYSKSSLLFEEDLKNIKAFFIGSFLSSVCNSGNSGTGTERINRRSVRTPHPVSLSFIEEALNVSQKTAFTYRKLAEKYRYINMDENIQQVVNLTPLDVKHVRQNHSGYLKLSLLGNPNPTNIRVEQLLVRSGKVYAQLPNLIYPKMVLKNRKLRKHKYQSNTTGGSCW